MINFPYYYNRIIAKNTHHTYGKRQALGSLIVTESNLDHLANLLESLWGEQPEAFARNIEMAYYVWDHRTGHNLYMLDEDTQYASVPDVCETPRCALGFSPWVMPVHLYGKMNKHDPTELDIGLPAEFPFTHLSNWDDWGKHLFPACFRSPEDHAQMDVLCTSGDQSVPHMGWYTLCFDEHLSSKPSRVIQRLRRTAQLMRAHARKMYEFHYPREVYPEFYPEFYNKKAFKTITMEDFKTINSQERG